MVCKGDLHPHKGHSQSEEYKEILRQKFMGNKNPAKRPEVRNKIKKAKKGHFVSLNTRKKIREKIVKIWQEPDYRRKQIKSHKGYKQTEEAKRKRSGENSYNWQGGISFEPYGSYWTEEYKAAIRQRDNFTCQICGAYPSFIVHHKDYDKKNPDPKMKIILCQSCHSKTNFDRNYWTNYFKIDQTF